MSAVPAGLPSTWHAVNRYHLRIYAISSLPFGVPFASFRHAFDPASRAPGPAPSTVGSHRRQPTPSGPPCYRAERGGKAATGTLACRATALHRRRGRALRSLCLLPTGAGTGAPRRPLVGAGSPPQGRGAGQAGRGGRRVTRGGDGRTANRWRLGCTGRDGEPRHCLGAAAAAPGGAHRRRRRLAHLHRRTRRAAGAAGVQPRGRQRAAEAAGGTARAGALRPDHRRTRPGVADDPLPGGTRSGSVGSTTPRFGPRRRPAGSPRTIRRSHRPEGRSAASWPEPTPDAARHGPPPTRCWPRSRERPPTGRCWHFGKGSRGHGATSPCSSTPWPGGSPSGPVRRHRDRRVGVRRRGRPRRSNG